MNSKKLRALLLTIALASPMQLIAQSPNNDETRKSSLIKLEKAFIKENTLQQEVIKRCSAYGSIEDNKEFSQILEQIIGKLSTQTKSSGFKPDLEVTKEVSAKKDFKSFCQTQTTNTKSRVSQAREFLERASELLTEGQQR